MSVKYLDLDSVSSPFDFTIKLNGVEHKIKETTLEDFVENDKLINEQGLSGNATTEVKVMVQIIKRSIPSIDEKELMALTITQLGKIREFVMTANGERAEEPAGEDASGNEPTAN